MDGILVLVRHGESEWNAKNVWTGWTDIGLSEKGKEEARLAAGKLMDIHFDCAFTSRLVRASDTLQIILETLKISDLSVTIDAALNERNYGVFTGKNKLEIKAQLGEEEYSKLRRGWDYPIQDGESLKQVASRVIPYYEHVIVPLLKIGKHVLVVAHGNSLRALIKNLDHVSDEDISKVELATGEIICYRVDSEGRIISKEKRYQEQAAG
jgi:2,3-bisphosphoglycerate-dependent phosphoglycerate mutase